MGKIKLRPHHTLRFISAGVLVVVLIALAISFLTRSKRQLQVSEIASELEEQKIDKKEGLEVRGMKGDKEVYNITADKHYIGEDSLYHWEGNVRIYLLNRIEGEDVIIRGEQAIHDLEWSYFWLQGQATVEFKDLVVESSVLEYDVQKSVLKGDQTVRFSSETISGSAQMCDYFLSQKKAELRGEVHLKLLPSQETSVPIEIDTEYFEYFVGKGRGKAEGVIELTHGKSHATAGLLELLLSASREQIKSLFLKDRVKIILVDEFRKVGFFSDQTTLALYGDKCLMEADEILIKGYVDLPQIKRLEATGECTFKFISEKGSFTQIEGKEIAFDLTGEGDLKMLIVNRDVKISEEDKEKGFPRYIEGQRVQVLGNKNHLLIEGKDSLKARIWSKDSEISAQEITLFLESNNMEANKDTKVIIYPGEKSQDAFGFFSEENPVFITATDMRYSEDKKRYRFSGGAKIWQMKETIKAQEVTLGAETGAVWARGNVESVLPYRPKGKEEDSNVRIESSVMEYNPAKNMIVYREKIKLKAKDVVLSAKLLTIALEKETGDMINIVARDKVVVVKKPYEGHGDEARFDVKEEIITVVGNPVLFDKDKGKIEGGKLTFYMADGRIVVENKDRERSVTVIKS
jgi:lipopolysaccharide export system protein LptA